jgi:adenosyl cobinamide kinase/adenosyl cobinamide phosphate guanylyltransferase
MGWDQKRPDRKYYYRSRWVDGRSIKEYVGSGPSADLEAQKDERVRQERCARQAAWLADEQRLAVPTALLNEVHRLVGLLTTATLLVWGFHLHKGQWRRKRRSVHGRTGDDSGRTQSKAKTVTKKTGRKGKRGGDQCKH